MTRHVLKMYRGNRFLGGRSVANEIRNAAEKALEADPSAVVVLDFDGVEGMSHSLADELLTPLNELLHEAMRHRVIFVACSDEVREDLELVASMHSLLLPAMTAGGLSRACA